MDNETLTHWFNDLLWPLYSDFVKTPFPTKYKQGSKGEALKKILTLKPSDALRMRISQAVIAQIRHRKELYRQSGSMHKYLEVTAYDKFYSNRMCSTWLNQMGWEDEIPALVDVVESSGASYAGATCSEKGCNTPIHGPSYVKCSMHEGRTEESNLSLRAKLVEMDLTMNEGESLGEYALRCKNRALNILKGLGNGMRLRK